MAVGPGKYDDACTLVRESLEARAVVLMVVDGRLGSGFSCQMHSPNDSAMLVKVLRDVADQIEKDSNGTEQP